MDIALLDVDVGMVAEYFIKLIAAFLLALPVAWERERDTRIMGLRTFPLVAMGTCGFVMVANTFIGPDAPDAQARIMQGILGGIGFIGGGAILKGENHVAGTASAASIWMTGALGAAVAYDNLELAVLLALANLGVLALLTPLKRDPQDKL